MKYLISIADIFTAVVTVLVMWNHAGSRNWWLLYAASSIIFVALMAYKRLPGWAIAGVIFFCIGIRNFIVGG
jgi:hypothetical protein